MQLHGARGSRDVLGLRIAPHAGNQHRTKLLGSFDLLAQVYVTFVYVFDGATIARHHTFRVAVTQVACYHALLNTIVVGGAKRANGNARLAYDTSLVVYFSLSGDIIPASRTGRARRYARSILALLAHHRHKNALAFLDSDPRPLGVFGACMFQSAGLHAPPATVTSFRFNYQRFGHTNSSLAWPGFNRAPSSSPAPFDLIARRVIAESTRLHSALLRETQALFEAALPDSY